MKRLLLCAAVAVAASLPAVLLRLTGAHVPPAVVAAASGLAILGAGFLLSWGAEAAERHVSQGLAIAALALVTVLPEYVVDIYYAFRAGQNPGSSYVQFAAANMTGANRLLVGVAWPLVVVLYWWRSGRRAIELGPDNAIEVVFLGLATLYSFVIVWKESIGLADSAVLAGIFAAYVWRVSRLPRAEEDEEEVGPAAALERLPKRRQYAAMAVMTVLAAGILILVTEPFAESLVATGAALGFDQFLLIQWLAPLASEAPGVVVTVLFVLALRPTAALGTLVSDKINQWTLLVGMLPLFYSLGAGRVTALPLDPRQREEVFLTAAQSLLAVALLLRLRLDVWRALLLLALFLAQFALGFALQGDEPRAVRVLTGVAWVYLALAGVVLIRDRGLVVTRVRTGLSGRVG